MKKKIFLFIFIVFSVLFSLNTSTFASNICEDTFFTPVTKIDGVDVKPIYTFNDLTGRKIDIYPIVYFNNCSTRIYYLENGNDNPYKDRKNYYEGIKRRYFFYTEHGSYNYHLYGVYVPWVTSSSLGYNLSKLSGFDNEQYKEDPSIIYRNYYRSGTDGTGTAYVANGGTAHNIKNTAIIPNEGNIYADGSNGANKIPAHFTIKYAPKYDRDGTKYTFTDLVGKKAEFRYLGYSNIGTAVANPYFYHDTWSGSILGDITINTVARNSMRTYYEIVDNGNYKKDLFRHYVINNPNTTERDKYRKIRVFYNNESYSIQQVINAKNVNYVVDNYHTAFLPMGHPGATAGSWYTNRDANNSRYRELSTWSPPKPNLRLQSMAIRRGSTTLAEYEKKKPITFPFEVSKGRAFNDFTNITTLNYGETYTLTITVENTSNHSISNSNAIMDLYFLADNNANTHIGNFDKTDSRLVYRRITGSFNSNKRTMTFNFTFKPSDIINANNKLRIVAIIPNEYSTSNDNAILSDDYAHFVFGIQRNNLNLTSIEFLDESENVVTTIRGGYNYRVRYNFGYTGGSFDNATVRIENITVANQKDENIVYINNSSLQGTFNLRNNNTYSLTTSPFRVLGNSNEIFATGRIVADTLYNDNTNDDIRERYISSIPDLTVSITSTTPSTIRKQHNVAETRGLTVNYRINLNNGPSSNYQKVDVKFTVRNVTTNTVIGTSTDSVLITNGQNNLHHTIESVSLRSRSDTGIDTLRVEIEVNPSKNTPLKETNWNNNTATRDVTLEHNNYPICTTNTSVRRENTWTQSYRLIRERGITHSYSYRLCTSWTTTNGVRRCNSSSQVSFSACRYDTSTTFNNPTKDLYERYRFTKIEFTSDYGKFDLLNETGKITAGKGFELFIQLNYETNAVSEYNSMLWSDSSNSCSKNIPYPKPPSFTPSDRIYIILPDGQVISNNNRSGTVQMLHTSNTSGSVTNRTYSMLIRPSTTIELETRQIYIDPKTKNGTYQMVICTDVIHSNLTNNHLYDRRTLTFEVVGGHMDRVKFQLLR